MNTSPNEELRAIVKMTPKDFFFHAGLVVTLYWSAIAFINLLFTIINSTFPDRLDYYVNLSSIRFAVSSLIVIFPLFIVISWRLNRELMREPVREGLWIRRWLIYLTLFVAGAVVAGDLIALVNQLLGGEITIRFVLKVLVVLVVAGGAFGYYLFDLQRNWTTASRIPRAYAWISAGAVLLSFIGAFSIVGSPLEARKARFDERRVEDLQNIQYRILEYWRQKAELPAQLADLEDSISGYRAPKDPEDGGAYEYEIKGKEAFALCATFKLPTNGTKSALRAPSRPSFVGQDSDNWQHESGRACFNRTIDPELYPPTKKPPIP